METDLGKMQVRRLSLSRKRSAILTTSQHRSKPYYKPSTNKRNSRVNSSRSSKPLPSPLPNKDNSLNNMSPKIYPHPNEHPYRPHHLYATIPW